MDATGVTLGELVRVVGRLDAQMQSVGHQLSQVASDVRDVRTSLAAHVERQTERTAARNREMAEVRAEQRRLRDAQESTDRWRWSTAGRWAGLLAGAGITGGGTAAALTRLFGA